MTVRDLEGKLIVSCQADEGDAFYGFMDRFAQAAFDGGAGAIRANGPSDIRAIRNAVSLPVIGIQKVMQGDGKVLITPTFESAAALVEAGAQMVALDCTARGRDYGAIERLQRIKAELRVPVLADIATVEEAQAAERAGAGAVLSTMRGYTQETAHVTHFDPRFIEDLVRAVKIPVIAEGRIDRPELARQAIEAGAFAVVVGTAITRPHSVVRAFADAIAPTMPHTILGIDMGGTNTKIGLVSNLGELLWDETIPTPAHAGRDALLAHLVSCALRAPEASVIGIATAGWVNPETGQVVYATENLPGWTGTHIAGAVRAATGKPVFVENDANALAVGEKRFGAARDFNDFVCITLGTGVGGGCYIGGRLNHGAHCFANAFGHLSIEPNGRDCKCGQKGCLEVYTNIAALLGYADHRYPSAQTLIEAANAGETRALKAIGTFAARLADGCSLLVQLLDPEALILAGGIAQDNPHLIANLEKELSARVPVWTRRNLKILTSRTGYQAGILGAAAITI